MTVEQYKKEVESVIKLFQLQVHIYCVIRDNTAASCNARIMFEKDYKKVVSGNDIPHIAHLLMNDLNKRPWIGNVV